MGAIARDFFRSSPVLDFPLIALAIFMLVFLAVSVRVLITKGGRLDAAARLPLNDGLSQENGHE
jgi:cbb3-type cytochrome oxidase subunit 3